MPSSSAQSESGIGILIEVFAFIGSFTILFLLYTYRKKIIRLFRLPFRLRARTTACSIDSVEKDQDPSQDIEKGDSSNAKAGQSLDSGSLARVLEYLHGLPPEACDFISMRSVSVYSSEEESGGGQIGSGGHGNEGRTEESLESDWVEVIQNFPSPSNPALLKRLSENTHMIGLGLVVDDADAIHAAGDNGNFEMRHLPAAPPSSPASEMRSTKSCASTGNTSSSTLRPSPSVESVSVPPSVRPVTVDS